NDDGFDDMLIGAVGGDGLGNVSSNAGEAYVVFGKSNWSGTSFLNLSTLNGSNGFVIQGGDAADGSGISVASADMNHDGFSDLIIGVDGGSGPQNTTPNAGEVSIVFGKANWIGTPSISLASLNGSNGFKIYGVDAVDRIGGSVSVGDIN